MAAASQEWVEIIEPESHERMFANPTTGEIVFTPPEGAPFKPLSSNQWWELYDTVSDKNYYYNAHTGDTVWSKPSDGADIISLTKLQSATDTTDDGEGATPSPSPAIIEPPADGSSKHISTSSLFSRELGTISPLQIEVEVDGHRFSTLDPVGPLHSFNGVDQLGTSVQRTVSPASSNPTPPPASSNSTLSSAATTPLSDRPSATLSSATGDVATHGQAETRRGLPLRRPGSLDATDQVGYLAGDVDEMTFKQKSRTLDNFSRKSKSRAAPPHGGTGSGGTLPGTYRSGRAPTHSAPKAPPAAPSERAGRRVSEDQGAVGYSKSSSVESGATAGVEFRAGSIKKTHMRAKSDSIPPAPAPPPFKRPATISADSLEHFQDLAQHKKGLFRRKKVTIANMLAWTKDPIKQPMIITRDKQQRKEAVEMFKLVLQFMGDKRSRVKNPDVIALDISSRVWDKKGLRDELYIQLCRQTTSNTSPTSLQRGWELFAICLAFFPPTIKFRSYLEGYLWRHIDPTPQNKGVPVEVYAQYCHKRVERMTQSGAKKGSKKPSLEELQHAKDAPFHPPLFGTTLEDVMEQQQSEHPDLPIPWVVTALCEAVITLQGPQTEGIFRVPGDIDEVNVLKLLVERGLLPLHQITDPHIPASLLKLWFRELEDPLIPEEYYQECIDNCEHWQNAISLVDSLPDLNKALLLYLVKYLQNFISPETIETTKMGAENLAMVWAPNLLRCPSDDHTLIFQNTRKEMAFLRLLIKYYVDSRDTASV